MLRAETAEHAVVLCVGRAATRTDTGDARYEGLYEGPGRLLKALLEGRSIP
jgi:hypothetical protein